MNSAAILRLREANDKISPSTNSQSQRAKNRIIIDQALREAEVLRCKTAQLGRVWKHNAELLHQEREHRKTVEIALLDQTKASDDQIKGLHHILETLDSRIRLLNTENSKLESGAARYDELCRAQLQMVDALQERISAAEAEKQNSLRNVESLISEMKLKTSAIEQVLLSTDQDIAHEEMENLNLRLQLGLGGS